MKFVDRKDTIPLPTAEERAKAKINWSTKMVPLPDNERSFIDYEYNKNNNILADVDKNDYARRAMRKDSK